ncbi:DUF4382 domain-containing protein [Natranaeroarchaeum aerophilus]|uniref:DUF4382 domain-containing protein n=1 Tax=Natranaeroarchaeum aerophilus TaxID=2917711 RepID=A0AAE3K519_9EURY|nr:DUF4382 domain-containing protein [Natranaeroarchaeum aerophilus]MCL9813611.1 DUF4382 domain-containing protein [Natranaeroarchaeum aerophilus]
MTNDIRTTDRRSYLKMTGGAAAIATTGLAGCLGDATGTLATSVTDQPEDIGDFESCIVTIEGIWLGPDDADAGDTGDDEDGEPAGREYYEFDEPQEADLVQLQGEETQLIDDRDLDTAEYEFLQLDVSDIVGTLEDGDTAEMDTPGEAPLTFNEPFEIREDVRTSFTADFAPVRQGQTNRYILRPVPEGIQVHYDDEEDDE